GARNRPLPAAPGSRRPGGAGGVPAPARAPALADPDGRSPAARALPPLAPALPRHSPAQRVRTDRMLGRRHAPDDPLRRRSGAGADPDRPAGAEPAAPRARPPPAALAHRRPRRAVRGRSRRRPRLRARRRPHGAVVRARSLVPRGGSTPLPHRRPRALAHRRLARFPRPPRSPGQDPWLPHRARRGGGGPRETPTGPGRGGAGPRNRRSQSPGGVRDLRGGSPGRGRASRASAATAAG